MNSLKMPVYQTQQIREFERLAKERYRLDGNVLMQRAGQAAYEFLLKRWPQARRIAVFCGGGNNGGDGYILAQMAQDHGISVTVYQVGEMKNSSEETLHALNDCKKSGVEILAFSEHVDIRHPDVIVDAILGIGLEGLVRKEAANAIQKMTRARVPVLAIDVPSGIDSDTGSLHGVAVRASATITFIGNKLGLLTGSGIAYAGELALNDLQLPSDLYSAIKPVSERIQLSSYAHYLRARPRDWHKGLSGHVLVIGGEYGYSGAPRMAGEAALRTGAGLVSIATRRENALSMNAERPELMCHGIENIETLNALLTKADVVVLGPGLGQSEWSQMVWDAAIQFAKPMVVDADALNLLSRQPFQNSNWILTPHPGEASRLLNVSVEQVQKNRLQSILDLNARYTGACVLKGAGSLIGMEGHLPAVCDKGNPGMASAGMGDVLSGIIGGLLAQNIPLIDAAKMGVCLHAMAGDLAAREGERGLIATDLIPILRRLIN